MPQPPRGDPAEVAAAAATASDECSFAHRPRAVRRRRAQPSPASWKGEPGAYSPSGMGGGAELAAERRRRARQFDPQSVRAPPRARSTPACAAGPLRAGPVPGVLRHSGEEGHGDCGAGAKSRRPQPPAGKAQGLCEDQAQDRPAARPRARSKRRRRRYASSKSQDAVQRSGVGPWSWASARGMAGNTAGRSHKGNDRPIAILARAHGESSRRVFVDPGTNA